MPGKDRTGPDGNGERTGRCCGDCAPKEAEKTDSSKKPVSRGGFGCGRGCSRFLDE
ncbi:DUF5320 domain-containing protein [bacterium]|nr:DUF5320 domain-containing protein [bacterium]MBT6831483.1 DUF5320 domain-containing protein [bacterium]MBT6996508.1 DUF5320 domain-containing protein [bacterium]MBT7772716.1 DUF5320 domain-containing protein [bacterium]